MFRKYSTSLLTKCSHGQTALLCLAGWWGVLVASRHSWAIGSRPSWSSPRLLSGIMSAAHTICSSRGLFPSELLQHDLWWNGPEWLCESTIKWPNEPTLVQIPEPVEEKEICLHASAEVHPTLPILEWFSEFTRLKRVTAWVFRFVENCTLK